MCLMLQAPLKGSVPREYLQNAYDHNSDGWGIMYAHAGRVVVHKEKSDIEAFFAIWDTIPDNKNVAAHFRFGTSGPMNSNACHPFKILSKDDGDAFDLYGMHNGVLRDSRYNGTQKASDTMQYFAAMTRQLRLARDPLDLLRSKDWRGDQEALLGNPNKVILLEGNGRWTYLNRSQGDMEAGVWYSNKYSLCKVYSGHGKGKAANRTDFYDAWEKEYPGYSLSSYSSGASYGNSTKRMDDAYKATIGPRPAYTRPWGMRMGAEGADSHEYWRPVLAGYERFAKNPDTGAFYRDLPHDDEKIGADKCIVLPQNNLIRFYPKNEQAFMRGDLHTFKMEGGEHIAEPVGSNVTLYTKSEASAAVQGHALLDVQDVARVADECGIKALLCRETNEPCQVLCTTSCTGGTAETSVRTFPLAVHVQGQRMGSKTPLEALAEQEAVLQAQAEEDEEDADEQYFDQLFSEQNLRTMGEEEMIDVCAEYPDLAAVALGRLLNRPWAWEVAS